MAIGLLSQQIPPSAKFTLMPSRKALVPAVRFAVVAAMVCPFTTVLPVKVPEYFLFFLGGGVVINAQQVEKGAHA